MTYEDALKHISSLEHKFPNGTNENEKSLLGWGLHSETLQPLALTNSPQSNIWTAQLEAPNVVKPFSGWKLLYPENFGTPNAFSGKVMKHKKGNIYLGLSEALFQSEKSGVYVKLNENGKPEGPWWLRPWDMFFDGRFETITSVKEWPYI